MLLKHVYMGWKVQRTLKLDISFILENFFISVAIFTQVASAPLIRQSIVEKTRPKPGTPSTLRIYGTATTKTTSKRHEVL